MKNTFVIPAKAGIQLGTAKKSWTPVFTGVTFIFALLLATAVHAQQANPDATAALQERLVRAAADIRAVEAQLQIVEDHLASLEIKRSNLEKDYIARRQNMAATLAALTRMSRTPREAVLIRPGGPLQAARTTMLLSASVPAIETQAASYRGLLEELEKTRATLAERAAQAQDARADLAARHAQITALLNDRDSIHDFAAENAAVANLAHDAHTLRDLLSALDGGKARPESQIVSVPTGDGQLPVSGVVRIRYGQRDPVIGGKSSGISIETLPGSIVVAPLGGVVRYAGPFKGYGNIVIIAHQGGYHSLIAGLDKISVSAGQTIVSGEPIAILKSVEEANQDNPSARRSVYYELRYGGQPIDPSRKLPTLG